MSGAHEFQPLPATLGASRGAWTAQDAARAEMNRRTVERIAAQMASAADAKPLFHVLTDSEFADDKPAVEIVAGTGLTDDVGFGAIKGESGSGKSWILADLAVCVHNGIPWHGHAVRKRRVGIVVAEGARNFQRRIAAILDHYGLPPSARPLLICGTPDFLQKHMADAISDAFKAAGGIDWMAVDTYRQCSSGRENDSQDAQAWERSARNAAARCGARTVLYLHHEAKGTGEQRGSNALFGACDLELSVTESGGVISVAVTKDKADSKRHVGDFKLTKHKAAAYVEACEPGERSAKGARQPPSLKQQIIMDILAGIPGEAFVADVIEQAWAKEGGEGEPDRSQRSNLKARLVGVAPRCGFEVDGGTVRRRVRAVDDGEPLSFLD